MYFLFFHSSPLKNDVHFLHPKMSFMCEKYPPKITNGSLSILKSMVSRQCEDQHALARAAMHLILKKKHEKTTRKSSEKKIQKKHARRFLDRKNQQKSAVGCWYFFKKKKVLKKKRHFLKNPSLHNIADRNHLCSTHSLESTGFSR